MADDVRVTQFVPEIVQSSNDTDVRVTQFVPEAVQSANAGPVRVTQFVVEVIREFQCEGRPTPPAPIGTVQLAQIRRLLQTPPMANEQNWLFFSKFSLDVETGVKDPSKS